MCAPQNCCRPNDGLRPRGRSKGRQCGQRGSRPVELTGRRSCYPSKHGSGGSAEALPVPATEMAARIKMITSLAIAILRTSFLPKKWDAEYQYNLMVLDRAGVRGIIRFTVTLYSTPKITSVCASLPTMQTSLSSVMVVAAPAGKWECDDVRDRQPWTSTGDARPRRAFARRALPYSWNRGVARRGFDLLSARRSQGCGGAACRALRSRVSHPGIRRSNDCAARPRGE